MRILPKLLSGSVIVVASLYMAAASFYFVPYYNWQYAKAHGFLNWALFGEVVATIQGYSWPYYIFISPTNSPATERSLSHARAAIEYQAEAADILNKSDAATADKMSEAERSAFVSLKRKALSEAKLVDIEELNRLYPNFGEHFESEFVQGLRLQLDSFSLLEDPQRSTNIDTAVRAHQGRLLYNKFIDWYNTHRKDIYRPR